MIPAMVIQKIVPKVLDMVLRQFKGIEKIDKLVSYMEEDNEADQKIKLLEKGFMQLADELDELNDYNLAPYYAIEYFHEF